MNTTETEAWTHGTDGQLPEEKRVGRTECKNVEGLAKEHICKTHRHRQLCGDGQARGKGGLGGGKQRKGQ